MSIKFNKKGMTLVEITVVLLIASILMTITGGILINSLGYFQDTTALSTDKSVGDGILDFINSEIEYSSDVRIQENQPGGNDWHSIYVENGQLYRDGVAVFDEDYYYNKRKLEINVNGFKNGYRLDMKIYLKKNNEIKYRTSHTFEFLNLKKTKKADSTYNPFNNVLSKVSVFNERNTEKNNEKYRVWYKKDYSEIKPDEEKKDDSTDTDQTKDGTVADIIFNIDANNYWGVYHDDIGYSYKKGDIVWYNNSWWQKVNDYHNDKYPGSSAVSWKKLDRNFDINSAYDKGDIVIYDKKYYQCKSDYFDSNHPPYNDKIGQWDCLGDINNPDVVAKVKNNTYDNTYNNTLKTVVKKYLSDEKYNDALMSITKQGYEEYDATKSYKKGDIIKKESSCDSDFYDLWMACVDTNLPPNSPANGWIKLDNEWDSCSSYINGDIVYCKKEGLNSFIVAIKDIFEDTVPYHDVFYPKNFWNTVQYW